MQGRTWNEIDRCVWDAIRDCCKAIAQFSQVDGAVLMTDRFELLWFGCEIRIDRESLDLKRALDWSVDVSVPVAIDAFGMRHRSAFRFCNEFSGAVALVISQDGQVKLITRRPQGLLYWDITPLGVFLQ
jgi:DNA integrity scanning protein DisA with diadenylate cyclase activity